MANSSKPLDRTGVSVALLSYFLWGFFPIYWKFLKHIEAPEILVHRMIWSFVFYFVLIKLTTPWPNRQIFGQRPFDWGLGLLAGVLLSVNWGIYIYAVNAGHVLEGSLAYFINPLLNVLIGVLFFSEELPRALLWAVILAGCGVLFKIVSAGVFPWISIVLAVTFCLYGVVKKKLTVEPRISSVLEGASVLVPAVALAFYYRSQSSFSLTGLDWLLFIFSGVVTGLPLFLFSVAVQRVPYSFLGMVQFVAPTLQFLVGYYLYGETVNLGGWISFGFIWLGAGIYLQHQLRKTFSEAQSGA